MFRISFNFRDYRMHCGEFDVREVRYVSPVAAIELLLSLDWEFAAPSVERA
jgi:hypothetical protein